MDTKALRQKVLDLAIRGKLVPQDPSDEPASVLLERIRQQKQQMVKEGKLKAKDIKNDTIIFVGEDNLHYEKFTDGTVNCIEDELPFELPDGWEWSRLASICSLISDIDHKMPKAVDNGVLFLSAKDLLNDGTINYTDDVKMISEEDFLRLSRKALPQKNDIIYSRIGACLGKARVVTKDIRFIVSYSCCTIRPVIIDSTFLASILDGDFVLNQAKEGTQSVGVPDLGMASIKQFLIPIPPLIEQQRIDEGLQYALNIVQQISTERDDLSLAVAQAKSKILDLAIRGKLVPQNPDDEPASVLLERIRGEKEDRIRQGKIKRDKKESIIFRGEDNSYYEKMADGKLHCLDDQLPFELPDGWEWCNLSMIGTTNIGLTYRPTDIEPDGVIVLRSCNIVNEQIDLSDLVRVKTTIRENQYVQKNDILICARNGSRALVGKCALISDFGEAASFGAFMAIYRTEYFEYIVHYLRSSFFRSVFDDSNSTAINQLTQDMLKRAIVPFPPLSEQHRIAETIEAMLIELNQMEKSLN